MTRKRVLIAIAGLGALLFVAYGCARQLYLIGYMQGIADHGASEAVGKVDALRKLRRGEASAATSALESSLDSNILVFSIFDEDLDRHLNPLYDSKARCRWMSFVAEYREEHSTNATNATIQSKIRETLRRYPPVKCSAPQGAPPTD